jgi:hypothetical protein
MRSTTRQRFSLILGLVALVSAAAAGAAEPGRAGGHFTLVQDGQPQAALVLSKEAFAPPADQGKRRAKRPQRAEPISAEQEAARQIQLYCEKISSATLPIVQAGDDLKGLKPVYLGAAADPALLDAVKAKGADPGSFALVVAADRASIRGLSPEATFYGVCEVLEQLGVRWFFPGELGTVIPESKTLLLRQQTTIQVPSFPSRYLQGVADDAWERHLRAGGPRFPSAHGVRLGVRPETLFQQHPEYFALRNGKRSTSQLCISNPEVLKLAIESTRQFFRDNPNSDIIGMGANDGRGFCECDRCKALDAGDYDPFGHCESMTDRYVWFFNKVLEGIQDEFPDKRIGFYAYAAYCRPPVKVKPDPRLVPAVAMITLCRIHGMNNPVCPEKSYEKWIIQEWGKLVPQVYYRGYWYNLADPGLPFLMIRRIAQEVPLGKQLHVAGWRTECMTNWAGSSPSLYIAHKLMWDHTANVETLLDDYCAKSFGPAAGPMRRYIDLLDKTVYDADYHTGSIWDMALVYPKAVRDHARTLLDEAAGLVPPDSLYARRVAIYRKSFAFLEGFADAMEGRTVHDYARAKRGLDTMIAMREELSAGRPSLITKKAEDYMNRYLTSTITQGYVRTTGGNRLLAGLKDEWQFQIDPERVGEAVGWRDPSRTGGNWQTIRTSSRTWSDQGLRYYKGLAWYRQTIDIPAEAEGKRVFLWFGAIDEMAKVWVNGRPIGVSPRIVFKPFELDATEAIRPGQPNTVVVCVSNETLNELGTGGIMGPVMFYIPAAGKDAKPENSKPLGRVFPEY